MGSSLGLANTQLCYLWGGNLSGPQSLTVQQGGLQRSEILKTSHWILQLAFKSDLPKTTEGAAPHLPMAFATPHFTLRNPSLPRLQGEKKVLCS